MHPLVVVDATFRFNGGGEMLEADSSRFIPRPLPMIGILTHKGRLGKEEGKETGWQILVIRRNSRYCRVVAQLAV
jgi:hypothetical protein